jgi:hypothetical protein
MVAETENIIWVKSNRNLFRVIRHACNFFLLVLIFNPNIFNLSDRQHMLLGIVTGFLLAQIAIIRSSGKKNTGLMIYDEGLQDLSTGDFLPWEGIQNVRFSENFVYRNCIFIDLVPNYQNQTFSKRFFRLIRAFNYMVFVSSVFIYTKDLDIEKEELLELLLLKKSQSAKSATLASL